MTVLVYNDNEIEQRDIDRYLNGTQMAIAGGKRIGDWLATDDYKRYVEALSAITRIPVIGLVIVKGGRPNLGGGTWIHPKLAIKLARWISVDFELWCDENIKTLVEKGTVSLIQETPKTTADMFLMSAQVLKEHDLRLNAVETRISFIEEVQTEA